MDHRHFRISHAARDGRLRKGGISANCQSRIFLHAWTVARESEVELLARPEPAHLRACVARMDRPRRLSGDGANRPSVSRTWDRARSAGGLARPTCLRESTD